MLDFLKSPLFPAFAGFLFGLLASVVGVAFIEPYRARMAAYLEFGKWLAILPSELRQMQKMTKHIVVSLEEVLQHAHQDPSWFPLVPHPIGEKLEVDTILEIRTKTLGWDRTEEAFDLVTTIWSAVVRTNWSLRAYNEQMTRISDLPPETSGLRKQRLALVMTLRHDFVSFVLFVDEKIKGIEKELRIWDDSAPRPTDAFRRSLTSEWRKRKLPLSAQIGFDRLHCMPYVEITNSTKNESLTIQEVAAFCGLPFFNNGLAFLPNGPAATRPPSPVTIPPKSKLRFRLDVWKEPSFVIQRKLDPDQAVVDSSFSKKSPLQIFRSIPLMPQQESWLEVQYDGHSPQEFLRGKVKEVFALALKNASPEQQAQFDRASPEEKEETEAA